MTVGLLHTGEHYPDDLSEYGVVYHYPNTQRPHSRDLGEIEATKNASRLSLPVFVITSSFNKSWTRDVHLGWIEDWDDNAQKFKVSFIKNVEPAKLLMEPEDKTPFTPKEETTSATTIANTRPGQQRFSFLVFQRYGEQCAVCDIDIPELLEAAHIIPKKHNGTDDPRNGLVLCALHHRALDVGLFCIDPDSLDILYKDNRPKSERLHITRKDIKHLEKYPHSIALKWLKDSWSE